MEAAESMVRLPALAAFGALLFSCSLRSAAPAAEPVHRFRYAWGADEHAVVAEELFIEATFEGERLSMRRSTKGQLRRLDEGAIGWLSSSGGLIERARVRAEGKELRLDERDDLDRLSWIAVGLASWHGADLPVGASDLTTNPGDGRVDAWAVREAVPCGDDRLCVRVNEWAWPGSREAQSFGMNAATLLHSRDQVVGTRVLAAATTHELLVEPQALRPWKQAVAVQLHLEVRKENGGLSYERARYALVRTFDWNEKPPPTPDDPVAKLADEASPVHRLRFAWTPGDRFAVREEAGEELSFSGQHMLRTDFESSYQLVVERASSGIRVRRHAVQLKNSDGAHAPWMEGTVWTIDPGGRFVSVRAGKALDALGTDPEFAAHVAGWQRFEEDRWHDLVQGWLAEETASGEPIPCNQNAAPPFCVRLTVAAEGDAAEAEASLAASLERWNEHEEWITGKARAVRHSKELVVEPDTMRPWYFEARTEIDWTLQSGEEARFVRRHVLQLTQRPRPRGKALHAHAPPPPKGKAKSAHSPR